MKKIIHPIALLASAFTAILFLSHCPKNVKSEIKMENRHTSDALKALEFLTDLRAYPNNDITPQRFFNAFSVEKMQLAKNHNLALPEWESIGPYNVAGRMLSLAVNPKNTKTLFAGSATGGLWRTYNSSSGSNWHRLATGFPVLGVMAIAIDPTDTNVIYIGTGEVYGYKNSIGGYAIRTTRGSYGIGILKSTNAGRTWIKSLDWTFSEQKGVQKLALNPKNSNVIYAGTTEGTYKSVNRGLTWNRIHQSSMVEDIIINPSDTSQVLISCGNLFSAGSGIYYSTDAGKNWTKSSFVSFTGKTLLDCFADNPNVVFASVGNSESGKGLYRSDDFGKSWIIVHNQNVQDYQGFFAHWVAVHPKDSKLVIHAGVNMYKSNDGGATLKTVSGLHVDHHNFAHDPVDPNVIYVANDGGVYRSSDFGESYKSIGSGLVTSQFYNGFSSSQQDSNFAIGGLQDNNSVIFNGTKNWKTVIGGDGCWALVNPTNDQNVFGSSQYNNLYRSVNRGQTFTNSNSGMTADAAFASPYGISFTNPNILYSGRKIVYKSTDNGVTWKTTNSGYSLDGNLVIAMDVHRKDENLVYVATAPTVTRAGIFMTSDGGLSWSKVTGTLPDRYPMDIALDPVDKNTAYVVFGGYDTPHAFKTIDGGISWKNISLGLPDVPTLAIAIDPFEPSNVYVGNDLGVYYSVDAGNNWAPLKEGLPEAVMAMELSISVKNRKLRLATHGNGVYQISLLSNRKGYLALTPLSLPAQFLVDKKIDFSVGVENKGTADYKDSLAVTLRIQNSQMDQIFIETKIIPSLRAGVMNKIEFTRNYSFTAPGQYRITYTKSFVNKIQNEESIAYTIEVRSVPKADFLVNNHPNPFNSETWVEYTLSNDTHVNLKLFDITGKEVSNIVNEKQLTGYYKVKLNAASMKLSSGVYILSLNTTNSNLSKKILYLK